ncbi:MAG: hypothetical protein QN174_02805 [Armatimonadota bacterium]|nr:hypothetical protein [Armatimonadota bacterium]MDR7421480.1 hypothetical protein [Armatimonadota bacterium]MDR7453072.1 hypothetical protein [Armatimonadota bacterium]MDR7457538.1 hypothetical protein [Armatimonadota bacterium]MDR7495879.1 hypothetical protein [Armatimonadota bacterium]
MSRPSPTTPAAADLFPARALRASLLPAAAIGLFPVAALAAALAAPEVAVLRHRAPVPLAANHLLTLGWATTVAIGVLGQLLPAAAGVRREAAGRPALRLAVHLVGLTAMIVGFLTGHYEAVAAGGLLVTAGIVVFLVDAAAVLRRRTRTLPVLPFAAGALACLAATVAWGVVLAENRRHLFSLALLGPMGLAIHVALGMIGWFGLLVVGMSYYLVPRFAGLREPAGLHPGAVGGGLAASVALTVAGVAVWPTLARAGMLLAGGSGLLYATDLTRMVRAWPPRPRDLTRVHWMVMIAKTVVLSAGAAAWALGLLPGLGVRWGVAAVVLFLLGWVTLAITGQALKVTPFLMWYYRYHRGLTAYEIPRLEAPYWPRGGGVVLAVLAAGPPLIAAGVLLAHRALAGLGGALFALGAAGIAALLAYSWLPAAWTGRNLRPPTEPG